MLLQYYKKQLKGEIKMKGYIYKATNNQNDRVFIGYNSSIPLQNVISRDKSYVKNGVHKEKKFYQAIRDIGLSNFKYEILMEIDCTNSKEQLLKWYHVVMGHYDSISNGYNDIRGNFQGRYNKMNKQQKKKC